MSTLTQAGGRIIPTKTGLIHYGNTDRFQADAYNGSTNDTPKFDFSAFPQVKVPEWMGTKQVVKF
jgi:hypothetical protein